MAGPGSSRVRVGIDIGGTKCLGVATVDGVIAAEDRQVTPEGDEAIVDTVVALTRRLCSSVGTEDARVGIGIAGLVDREGVVHLAPNLIGADGLNLKGQLKARLGLPVGVDNDATCAAWAEREIGAAKGLDDVVMVTLGTGIGGGLISGGRVCRGAHGFGGEVGHMVVDPNGPPCPCGQRGCWERFASGTGLGSLARETAEAGDGNRILDLAGGEPDEVRGEHVTQAASEGDPDALQLMARFAWWVSLGLVNLANIFDPQAFVIGGGVSAAGGALLQPTRVTFAKLIQGAGHRPPVDIVLASLGERAGALGAAHLA